MLDGIWQIGNVRGMKKNVRVKKLCFFREKLRWDRSEFVFSDTFFCCIVKGEKRRKMERFIFTETRRITCERKNAVVREMHTERRECPVALHQNLRIPLEQCHKKRIQFHCDWSRGFSVSCEFCLRDNHTCSIYSSTVNRTIWSNWAVCEEPDPCSHPSWNNELQMLFLICSRWCARRRSTLAWWMRVMEGRDRTIDSLGHLLKLFAYQSRFAA